MLEEFEAAVFERQEKIGTQRTARTVNRRRGRRPRLIIGSKRRPPRRPVKARRVEAARAPRPRAQGLPTR
jgi:hypothetical protein